MDRDLIFSIPKKIIRVVIAVKLAGACVKLGKAVYRSIPKYDTFEGIDPEVLIEQNTTDTDKIDLSVPENLPELP